MYQIPTSETCELLKSILSSTERHTNAKVSKLIRSFEGEKTSQNMATLLMELAEHPEFSADISISLQYYLDCFQELTHESSFAEAGVIIYNSSKIYARRVDQIHQKVKNLTLSLSSETSSWPDVNHDTTSNTTPEIRVKKRHLVEINGAYEADMVPKRIKKMPYSKRFQDVTPKRSNVFKKTWRKGSVSRNLYIHPATWKHSYIDDFDYEDGIDSKKNYKLFTHHLEHRYNTLIADINFIMYFKMKDYIDSEWRDSSLPDLWPPFSDAYIEQYVSVEDFILIKEGHNTEQTSDAYKAQQKPMCNFVISNAEKKNKESQDCSENYKIELKLNSNSPENKTTQLSESKNCFSEYSLVTEEDSLRCSKTNNSMEYSAELLVDKDLSSISNDHQSETNVEAVDSVKTNEEDLSTLKIILPHLAVGGIYFSELRDKDRQMLSPVVVAQDVFNCVKDKSNIVIKVDEEIKHLFGINEPSKDIFTMPFYEREELVIPLNILKIPLKLFKKRNRFKLGPEFNLSKKERLKKYVRRSSIDGVTAARAWVYLGEDDKGVHTSPASSPYHEPELLGFPEELLIDKNRTISRDSGISLQQADKETTQSFGTSNNAFNNIINEDLTKAQKELHSTKISEDSHEVITSSNNNFPENQRKENDDKETRVRTKVQNWHYHLHPILACSRERHHFDVFALGSEIMSQFNECEENMEKVSFKDVIEEKDESLIPRYFLSMLLLVNQGNISIDVQNKSSNEPSELHDIHLKLVSRNRNIVSLEDNIGLLTPQTTPTHKSKQNVLTIVRTLKSVPEVLKMDDRDSGIAISEGSIT